MKVNLSSSEWKLMKPLWEQPPRTIMELTAALRTETGWTKNTVITMLSRLEAKGAVRCQGPDRLGVHRYRQLGAELPAAGPSSTTRPWTAGTPPGRRRRAFWAGSMGAAWAP